LRTSLQSSFIATDSYLIIFARLTYIPVHAFESYSRQFTLAFMEGIENPVVLVWNCRVWHRLNVMLYRHCYDAELRVWGSMDGVFLCLKELSLNLGPLLWGRAQLLMRPCFHHTRVDYWVLGFFSFAFCFFPLFVGLGAFGLILFKYSLTEITSTSCFVKLICSLYF
jgi:hypothetical protein